VRKNPSPQDSKPWPGCQKVMRIPRCSAFLWKPRWDEHFVSLHLHGVKRNDAGAGRFQHADMFLNCCTFCGALCLERGLRDPEGKSGSYRFRAVAEMTIISNNDNEKSKRIAGNLRRSLMAFTFRVGRRE